MQPNPSPKAPDEKIIALCDANEKVVSEYINDYELDDGEHCPYAPNEAESALIADAIHGLLVDDEFVATFNAWQDVVRATRAIEAEVRTLAAGEQLEPSPLSGKYGTVLTPFVSVMEAELHANAGKGDRPGWLSMSRDQALLEIYWHTAKLSAAVKNSDAALIREHSADVANMAMMLLDVCGGLEACEATDKCWYCGSDGRTCEKPFDDAPCRRPAEATAFVVPLREQGEARLPNPHVGEDEHGNATFEWWRGARKLTLYLESDPNEQLLKSWGPNMHSEMVYVPTQDYKAVRAAFEWLSEGEETAVLREPAMAELREYLVGMRAYHASSIAQNSPEVLEHLKAMDSWISALAGVGPNEGSAHPVDAASTTLPLGDLVSRGGK